MGTWTGLTSLCQDSASHVRSSRNRWQPTSKQEKKKGYKKLFQSFNPYFHSPVRNHGPLRAPRRHRFGTLWRRSGCPAAPAASGIFVDRFAPARPRWSGLFVVIRFALACQAPCVHVRGSLRRRFSRRWRGLRADELRAAHVHQAPEQSGCLRLGGRRG